MATDDRWQDGAGPMADNDRDTDWVFDRAAECASSDERRDAAGRAWLTQREHVAANSVFYRRKYRELGLELNAQASLAELVDFPFTTKDELRLAQERSAPFGEHLAVPAANVKRVYQTSGTSGVPSRIALTPEDVSTWTTIGCRSCFATGIRPHNSVLTTFGAGPFVVGHIHDVIANLGPRTVPIGPGDTDRAISTLRSGLVDTMLTTPSFALYLADRFQRTGGAQELGLIHMITGGEPGGGLPSIRSHIETVFNTRLTEAMGLGDISPSLFGECPAQRGMHFGGDGLVWPELINEHGEAIPIEPGARGELVYTHLHREAMPLIRFRSGDFVEILTTECPCGRTSFTMRARGRVDDMFIVRGVNVYPSAVQAVVGSFAPSVTGRVRVVISDGPSVSPPVPIDVEIPETGEENPTVAHAIEAALHETLKFRAMVRFVDASDFGDASYKTRPTRRDDNP